LYRDTPDGDIASAYTNVWAILADMPCDHAALAEKIVGDRSLCELTVFSTYFACRALVKAGRYELMPRLLEPWRRMLQWGFTTCPETPDFALGRSDCHAWGCGPMVELLGEVLGVYPAEPGYAVIGLAPKPAGLTFARGRVPLTRLTGQEPARFVHVEWRIENGRFLLIAQTPAGIPCRLSLPDGRQEHLPQGGRVERQARLTT
jgi:hypothetical protein